MAEITFNNVDITFPVYSVKGRSITSRILETLTGGKLDSDPNGTVIVNALAGVSFHLEPGDRLAIIGPNGSGKSTLLRALARVYRPTRGEVSVRGKVSSLIDISLGINPEATGSENIFLRGYLLGLSKAEIIKKYEDIVAFSELGQYIDMPVRTYSSGMQMRLGFAISTAVESDILLMDEWLAVGDESFHKKAEKRLLDLMSQTEILVLASHSRDLIERICNKALWLEHGREAAFGPVSEVCDAYFTTA